VSCKKCKAFQWDATRDLLRHTRDGKNAHQRSPATPWNNNFLGPEMTHSNRRHLDIIRFSSARHRPSKEQFVSPSDHQLQVTSFSSGTCVSNRPKIIPHIRYNAMCPRLRWKWRFSYRSTAGSDSSQIMHPKNVGIGIRCAYQSIDTHIRTPIDIPLQRVSYRALAGEGYFGMKSQTNLIPTNTSAGAKHSRCMGGRDNNCPRITRIAHHL